jgi:hypothetical protein
MYLRVPAFARRATSLNMCNSGSRSKPAWPEDPPTSMYARSWLIRLGLALLWPATVGVAPAPPAISVEWQPAVDIAAGRGERGPWRQNESRYDFVDDPAVAIGERGETAVAWVVQAKKDVFFQRLSAQGQPQLAEPVNVSRSPGTFSWLPRLAMVPDAPEKLLIAWQEIIFSGGSHGGDILFAASQDGGRTFSRPVNLSSSIGGDGKGRITRDIWHNGSFDLIAGPRGNVYVTWTEYEGALWFTRSGDGGLNFSRPQRIAGGDRDDPARAPALALGADGSIYLAWTVGENHAADIHLAKSIDGGRSFSPARTVAPSSNYSDAPKLAVDEAGVLHLVHAESSGGPWGDYHVRHSSSADGGRTFVPTRVVSAPLPAGARSAAFPSLAVDGKGRLYVLSELFAHAQQAPRGLALSVSTDGGRSFSAPLLVPGSADPGGGFNGSSQGLLMRKVAVNPAGALAVANSSLKPGAYSRVWLMRGTVQTR